MFGPYTLRRESNGLSSHELWAVGDMFLLIFFFPDNIELWKMRMYTHIFWNKSHFTHAQEYISIYHDKEIVKLISRDFGTQQNRENKNLPSRENCLMYAVRLPLTEYSVQSGS